MNGHKLYEYLANKQQLSLIETPTDFGKELKRRIEQGSGVMHIADFAFCVDMKISATDPNFHNVLNALSTMSAGPEFEMSYKKLNEIADDLIAGREVNLDY